MPSLEAARATEAAFLEDVCRHRGDDTPRLILADWLDEHGQPERAEFIRVGCELARYAPTLLEEHVAEISEWADGGKFNSLRRRERELLGRTATMTIWQVFEPEYSWLPEPVRHWFETGPRDGRHDRFWEWRRGFVEEVALPVETFLAHAAALFRAAPVRRVTLIGKEPWHPGNGSYLMRQDGQDTGEFRWALPGPLYDLLDGWDKSLEGHWKRWPARAVALDALAAACLLYGRRAAWPCPECKGRGRNGAVPSLPGWPCPACAGRGHTVEEG